MQKNIKYPNYNFVSDISDADYTDTNNRQSNGKKALYVFGTGFLWLIKTLFVGIGYLLYFILLIPLKIFGIWLGERITKYLDTLVIQFISVFIKWILPLIIIGLIIMFRDTIWNLIK